jgi:hypothetical protein
MSTTHTMPGRVAIAINDLLDTCAEIQSGQRVLIVASPDGLTGGINLVDEVVVAWIEDAVRQRGAHPTALWTDIPARVHEWRLPSEFTAAVAGVDLVISHAFDLPFEELYELRDLMAQHRAVFVRNMATTADLLASDWAQTPYELVSEIRIRTARLFSEGLDWSLTHSNGTSLMGKVRSPLPPGRKYADYRSEGFYRPFPEGVFSPINIAETEGILVFDHTSPWWARYIGVAPRFANPVRIIIEKNRIRGFAGGEEARAMERFLGEMASRVGEMMYEAFALHGGVHPHAKIVRRQCAHDAYRAFIEHHDAGNLHLHLGVVPPEHRETYPYFVHISGDLRGATLKLGNELVYERGRLSLLDSPEIKEIAARYPDRPGV